MDHLLFIKVVNLSWIVIMVTIYFMENHFKKRGDIIKVTFLKRVYWILAILLVVLVIYTF
jgi:hypothetical protein